jgi:hypothetical protein
MKKRLKGETKMIEQIDVRDLPEKEVRFIQQLVELLKEKTHLQAKKNNAKTAREKIKLQTYRLGKVHGNLSRREIYDHI